MFFRGLLYTLILAMTCYGCASSTSRTYRVAGEQFDLSKLGKQRANVVMAALSQVGTPYVYSGATPGQALDCSALTQYAYSAAGISIPRVSTAQKASARPVEQQPEPGDLVFFKTGPNQYHVGMMVDHDRFVHASTSKKRVRLSHLEQHYWQQRYLGAGTYLH
ncbi:MAG: hypothetical protein N838_08745 [Thiohalocapsa sp. PB-PSB1]|jgi:cell wall-associated NlpC family hydrolase|nr:MAG: hypothetical protein N838_08745 [Thiohalocapsa sp. PB-PSB1]